MDPYLSLSFPMQALLRSAYGLCLLGTLLFTIPHAHRFFATQAQAGYLDSSPWRDRLLSPAGRSLVLLSWLWSACSLVLGQYSLLAALTALCWARYFFVEMRWKGICRGMGAPGFMLYWLGALVFFLEYSSAYAPQGWLRSLVILTFKVDFAIIFLCAGQYKFFSGYPHNNGMERGMVNPWWGHWPNFFRRFQPDHWVFRGLNHLAYLTEIVAGVMMLKPSLAPWGALLLAVSFIFIAANIRLGLLCETVICCCLLFASPGCWLDKAAQSFLPQDPPLGGPSTPWASYVLGAAMLFYLILLPITKAGLYYNFYARKRLPRLWQKWQDFWANWTGIIIWRVFTLDNTNFYVKVSLLDESTGKERTYSHFGFPESFWRLDWRYWHVCEFVCLACVFTTLKYFPNDPALFRRRLLTYSASIPRNPGEIIVFDYYQIDKASKFSDQWTGRYFANPNHQMVWSDGQLSPVSSCDAGRFAQLLEGHRVGSYAPADPEGTGQ